VRLKVFLERFEVPRRTPGIRKTSIASLFSLGQRQRSAGNETDSFIGSVKNATWPFHHTLVACSVVFEALLEPGARLTKAIVQVFCHFLVPITPTTKTQPGDSSFLARVCSSSVVNKMQLLLMLEHILNRTTHWLVYKSCTGWEKDRHIPFQRNCQDVPGPLVHIVFSRRP
jgi:hypothetical protein